MELGSARGGLDTGNIIRADAASGHDADTPCRLLNQFGNQGTAFFRRRRSAGGEDTVATGFYELLKGGKGITTGIKSPVEGKGELSGSFPQAVKEAGIYLTFLRQASRSDTVHSCLPAKTDIGEHGLYLGFRIKEIAATGANDGVYT
jgi:hypothetical protein